jgi:hypothetical protein
MNKKEANKKFVGVRMRPSLYNVLSEQAHQQHISISKLIRQILNNYRIDKYGDDNEWKLIGWSLLGIHSHQLAKYRLVSEDFLDFISLIDEAAIDITINVLPIKDAHYHFTAILRGFNIYFTVERAQEKTISITQFFNALENKFKEAYNEKLQLQDDFDTNK